jgi:hypothetical protein
MPFSAVRRNNVMSTVTLEVKIQIDEPEKKARSIQTNYYLLDSDAWTKIMKQLDAETKSDPKRVHHGVIYDKAR